MRATVTAIAGQTLPRGARGPIAQAARGLRPSRLRVQVILGDDALLRGLNRRFRRRDRATDVLSFRYEARPGAGEGPDAEVYVSLARAAAQARLAGRTAAQEVVMLALHGLLHVQGHDHHRPAERQRMHAAEAAALRRLARRWPRFAVRPLVAPPRRRTAGGRP